MRGDPYSSNLHAMDNALCEPLVLSENYHIFKSSVTSMVRLFFLVFQGFVLIPVCMEWVQQIKTPEAVSGNFVLGKLSLVAVS